MTIQFENRIDAGQKLGDKLGYLGNLPRLLILGLPRGGVPVASQVATRLAAPLDVFVVRKLGVPGHEELAMGAVASGGVQVLNSEVVITLRIPPAVIDQVAVKELRELGRRERIYRGHRPFPDLRHANVVLVDDGVATGSTMLAAVRAIRKMQPDLLVVAAPVMAQDAAATLAREADACVTLAIPEPFGGVGMWYADFSQTTDAEVIQLLEASLRVPAAPVGGGETSHVPAA